MNDIKIPQVTAQLFIGQIQVYPFDFTNSFASGDAIALPGDVTVNVYPTVTGLDASGVAVSGMVAQLTIDASGVAASENNREVMIEVSAVATPSGLSDLLPMKLILKGKYAELQAPES